MLDKDSAFESNFNRQDNLTPSFEDAHDLKASFFQEEGGGLFSAPKLDFTELEEYRETGEYNFEDHFDLFRDNHPLPALNYSNFQESIDGNFSDIIGDIAISGDRDSLLSPDLNSKELLSGEGNLERGEGIMGGEKMALIPALLRHSDLSLEDLPVGERDFQSIDRTADEGKASPIPALLKNSELNPEELLSGEGIMGGEKMALIPALLKNSDFSLENLPVGERDFQSIDRTAGEGKAFSNLNDLDLDIENLPFAQDSKKLDIAADNNISKPRPYSKLEFLTGEEINS